MISSVRRLLALVLFAAVVGFAMIGTAGPAAADTPEGWPAKEPVDVWHAVLVLGGVPLLVVLAIAVLVYAPALARGEKVAPHGGTPEEQWIGGPRKERAELAAPDSADSAAGGAGGSW